MQGWRTEMEDAHTIKPSISVLPDHSFFAVFDGHGGDFSAHFAAQHLYHCFLRRFEFKIYIDSSPPRDPEQIARALENAFLDVDEQLRNENKKQTNKRSGCTAIVAVISPTHIIVANAGDSRGAFRCEGHTKGLSEDHKPYEVTERERIEKAGGCVSAKRVDGELAVSRALGDFQYKDALKISDPRNFKVSPFPDVLIQKRKHDKDEIMILACDGIWDVMTNQNATTHIAKYADEGEQNPRLMAEELMCECLELKSRDNMSAIIVLFPAAMGLVGDGDGVMGRRQIRAEKAQAESLRKDSESKRDA
uniref:PPM-type phosphatase domain-containing protein n=1 Tax=Octactis speculum TaxID=3111310 RepID=A0A7S2HRS3_9STRA